MLRHTPFLMLLAATLANGLAVSGVLAAATPPEFTSPPDIRQNPNPSAPLAALVSFTASEPVSTSIRIRSGGLDHTLNYDTSRNPQQGLPVIGLRPEHANTVVVTIQNAAGEKTESKPLTYNAPNLPTAPEEFPAIKVTQSDPQATESGFRLFNPRRRIPRNAIRENDSQRRFGESFGMLLLVDQQGQPVWYYRTDSRIAGFSYQQSGRILFVTADFRLVEIDLLGNETRAWYAANRPQGSADNNTPVDLLTIHHDADLLENGNLLALSTTQKRLKNYFTSERDKNAPRADSLVMGDRVVEFTPSGEILWEWKAFEHLPARRIGYETFSGYWKRRGFPQTIDWSHANSVAKLDDGSAMVNFRYQSAIVNFSPDTGEINWIFGEPSGWPKKLQSKLFTLDGEGRWPWHQHAPTFTEEGTLMLFDNGNYQARPFEQPAKMADTRSRVAEYQLDFKTRTARQVWTSETADEQPVVSIAMGNASPLPDTGNVLAGYGAIMDPERIDEITWWTTSEFDQVTRCREYTHTTPARVVWELSLEPTGSNPRIGWNLFNCQVVKQLTP